MIVILDSNIIIKDYHFSSPNTLTFLYKKDEKEITSFDIENIYPVENDIINDDSISL